MAGMGIITRSLDKAIDRLPGWARVLFWLAVLAAAIYGVVREGPIFLLKAIFSPEL